GVEQCLLPGAVLGSPDLVQRLVRQGLVRAAQTQAAQNLAEQPPVGQADSDVRGGKAELAHDVDGESDDLGITPWAGVPAPIAVQLKVLPQPPSLLSLGAKELRYREPSNRLLQTVRLRRHHSRE